MDTVWGPGALQYVGTGLRCHASPVRDAMDRYSLIVVEEQDHTVAPIDQAGATGLALIRLDAAVDHGPAIVVRGAETEGAESGVLLDRFELPADSGAVQRENFWRLGSGPGIVGQSDGIRRGWFSLRRLRAARFFIDGAAV